MKKLFFIAAIACVALASCVKNELAPSVTQQDEITFATPVVGNLTKAVTGEIGNNYSKDENFVVYGWYCTEDSFNPDKCTVYMNGVTCKHNANRNVESDAGDQGAWEPATTYYWPKNGRLTFSAYSPAELVAGSIANNPKTGLIVSNYTVNTDVTKQYDFLYSDRAYNKTTSIGETNAVYDGVDILFRHALSSIHVKVKTDKTYPEGTIKVNSIIFKNVYCTADFKENLTTGTEGESKTSAAWVCHHGPKDIVIGSTAQAVAYDAAKYGTTAILIPQQFVVGENKIELVVNYTIKNGGGSTIDQVAELSLVANGSVDGGEATTIYQWVKGYRYTYNLTFSLNEIYFAPSVETWYDVAMNEMGI